jgi:hypothetical protein
MNLVFPWNDEDSRREPYFVPSLEAIPSYQQISQLIGKQCQGIEAYPINEVLEKKGYELYADETGVTRPTYGYCNPLANPLFESPQFVIYMAMNGLPRGSLVLHHDSQHDPSVFLQDLLPFTEPYDLSHELEEPSETYTDALKRACAL